MKRYLFFILPFFALTACKNTWTQEDKDMYYQSCIDDANDWAGSPDKAKAYCNCMLEKIVQKYPNVNDVMENMDSVIVDPDLRRCKAEIMKQP